jgi:hypothetical protein
VQGPGGLLAARRTQRDDRVGIAAVAGDRADDFDPIGARVAGLRVVLQR